MDEVIYAVKGMNQNASGGTLYEYGNEYIVRGLLSTNDIDELKKAVRKSQPFCYSGIQLSKLALLNINSIIADIVNHLVRPVPVTAFVKLVKLNGSRQLAALARKR